MGGVFPLNLSDPRDSEKIGTLGGEVRFSPGLVGIEGWLWSLLGWRMKRGRIFAEIKTVTAHLARDRGWALRRTRKRTPRAFLWEPAKMVV